MGKRHTEKSKLQLSLEREPEKQKENLPENLKSLILVAAISGIATFFLMFDLNEKKSESSTNVTHIAISNNQSFVNKITPLDSEGNGDNVDSDTRAKIDGQFMAYTAELLPIDFSNEVLKAEFLAAPYLKTEEKKEIINSHDKGNRSVAVITLWDNFDQDGDAVQISSGGVVIDIPIWHVPTTVFIPFIPGEPLIVQGLYDGGGGITAAIETLSGPVPLPVMAVGQTIILPLF